MTVKIDFKNQPETLLKAYQTVRQESLDICAPLQPEDYTIQPAGDVSPPKWHLGHTTWFFENFVLIPHLDNYQAFDLSLNYIFNSYYESQGPRILRSRRGNISRPDIGTAIKYREYVDKHMQDFLQQQQQHIDSDLHHLITIGLQHEQQHQELLVTDIKYILGTNPLYPAYRKKITRDSITGARPAEWLKFSEGLYEIGYEGEGFCWDNEKSVHKVYLQDFKIQDRLVTNGEYMDFLEAGGYEQFQHWLADGWDWVQELENKAPLYWYKQDDQWMQYTLNGLHPLDPSLPVTHLSYYEADAYARWRGLRLPTEQEWEVACKQRYDRVPEAGNFLEQRNYHPTMTQDKDDDQMLGQVWEWTGSAYLPYPDYPRFEGALGEYNGKFMVNQMILRGGSCATPYSHTRITYRNFFQPDKRWQFTGLRLAK